MVNQNRVFDILTDLATCLCAQIAEDDLTRTCFCGVIPGEAPAVGYFGDCEDENGIAFVRLSGAYPSASVGQQDVELRNCNSTLGIDVEMGILRNLPVGDETGNMPEDADILATTQLQVADMLAMRRAISCCLGSDDYIVGSYTPFGPDGGIVGGLWEVNLQVF